MTAPDDVRAKMVTTTALADALEVFWNAALGATHQHQDATANAVMAGMVEGFAAMAGRLREPIAHADLSGEVRELVEALQAARDYGAMTGAEWVIDKVDAALAKFTHQEKP